MKKKLFAGFLAVVLTAGTLPTGIFAAPSDDPDTENNLFLEEEYVDEEETGKREETEEGTDESTKESPDSLEDSSMEDSELEEEVEIEVSDSLNKKEKKEIILPDPGTVTGFEMQSQEDSLISLNYKVSMEELEEMLPQSIQVYLNNRSEAVEIPVTWVSEVDYETTSESYYLFWPEWDREMFPLVDGYGSEDYLPFVEVVIDSPVMMANAASSGIDNIVARAREMVDIRWTPVSNLNGFSSNDDQLTVYSAGVTYNGIPYGQQVSSGKWIPFSSSFDTFISAVNNASSPLYLSRGGYGDMNSTYYANDCSSFVSYCYGLPRMTTWSIGYSSQFTAVSGNNIYNAQIGDCFNCAGSHVEIITGMNYDASGTLVSVEVSEQTPPKARTVVYTPKQVQNLINTGYTLLRFIGRDSVAAPETYSGYSSDQQNPVKVIYSTEADSVMTFKDVYGDESVFKITVTGLQRYSKTDYEVAIWSEQNNQDDLKWVKLSRQTNGNYTATIKTSDFKHKGNFFAHLYKKDRFEYLCLKTDSFFVVPDVDPSTTADVTMESVTVSDLNAAAGSCRITVSGVSCTDGVKKIEIPVWSDAKQADIYWYQAKQLDDSTWYVDMNLSNHKYNFATYKIHVYGTNKYGKRVFTGETTATFTQPETSVTAEVKGTEVTITASNLYLPAGIKSVVIPTWSDENDQDDLTWVKASFDSATATATATIDAETYKHFGSFISHVYATDGNGKQQYMGGTSYTVAQPEYEYNEISCSYNPSTGAFSASIAHPHTSVGTVDSIVVPTWSGDSQDDIKWYEASKKSGSKWTISGNIKNHNGAGTYNLHFYARVGKKMVFLGSTEFTASIETDLFSVGKSSDGIKYPITVKGLTSPVALTKVKAAVWSEKNDQDDLVWYTLSGTDGTAVEAGKSVDLSGKIDIKKHKTEGSYKVHLYGITDSGKYNFIQELIINVSHTEETSITVIDPTEKDGKIKLSIMVENCNWTYTKITVPVWCSADQSDIYWYTAVQQENGSWTVNVDKSNHKNHTGTYQIHTYANFSNGIFGFLGSTTAKVS